MLSAVPPPVLVSSTAFFKDANRTAAMLSFRATRRLTSGFVRAKSVGPNARQSVSTTQKAPLAALFESGIFRPARSAARPPISAAPVAAAVPIATAMRAYEFAIPSDDGHRMTPLTIPAKLPATAATTKTRDPRPLRNKVEANVKSATNARRIHRGKSRLGSIIAGHQQTPDPAKVRSSKIVFRVTAAFSSCREMRSYVRDYPRGSQGTRTRGRIRPYRGMSQKGDPTR